MFRMLLYLMIGYVAFRIIQLGVRMATGSRRRRQDVDPFAEGHPPTPPVQDFKDVQDADFEDISQKDQKE